MNINITISVEEEVAKELKTKKNYSKFANDCLKDALKIKKMSLAEMKAELEARTILQQAEEKAKELRNGR